MSTIKEKGCVSMKIQAVLIDGFKNLSNVKISFDNITALVALNNFGKSNVLSGIDFGLAFIKATIEDKKEMMANSNLIPINCNMIGKIISMRWRCLLIFMVRSTSSSMALNLYGKTVRIWSRELFLSF